MEKNAYTLNDVIKRFKSIISEYEKSKDCDLQINYYKIIVKYLLIENKYKEIVLKSKKPLYHYFMYYLPQYGNDYFFFLYNTFNPVRYSCETFSSIEEIRNELKIF